MRPYSATVSGVKIETMEKDRLDVLIAEARRHEGRSPLYIIRMLKELPCPVPKNPPPPRDYGPHS